MRPLSESTLESCRAIAYFIAQRNGEDTASADVRAALLMDLLWKARQLNDRSRAVVLAQGMYYLLPASLKRLFPDDALGVTGLHDLPAWTRERKDVAIVTILKPELDAVLASIQLEPDARVNVAGFDFWRARVPRRHKTPVSIVVTRVGKPGNVPMAMRIQSLLTHFDVDLLMVIGVAAGFPDKLALGDVVVADRVYDYEHVRSEVHDSKIVEKPRPLIVEMPDRIALDLDLFELQWMKNLFGELSRKQGIAKSAGGRGWQDPKFLRGTIAAGERLIADGSLGTMRDNHDHRILAGDQEDSGFAQAAEFSSVPWCIFRGVSDHGDIDKPPTDEWHFAASLAASATGVAFLKYAYRPPTDDEF